MKKKEFSKKLLLNKITVADLDDTNLKAVQGGAPLTSQGVGNPCHTQCETGWCCGTIGDLIADD